MKNAILFILLLATACGKHPNQKHSEPQSDELTAKALALVPPESCLDTNESGCENVTLSVPETFYDSEQIQDRASTFESNVLHVDTTQAFALMARYRNQLLGVIKWAPGGELQLSRPSFAVRRFQREIIELTQNTNEKFIPAVKLSALAPHFLDISAKFDHGDVTLLHQLENNPRTGFLVFDNLNPSFEQANKTAFCSQNLEALSFASIRGAIELRKFSKMFKIDFITNPQGVEIRTIKSDWKWNCPEGEPSAEFIKTYLAIMRRDLYDAMFNEPSIIGIQSGYEQLASTPDDRYLDADATLRRRIRAGFFTALDDSKLAPDGFPLGVGDISLSQTQSANWDILDVHVNLGLARDKRNENHFSFPDSLAGLGETTLRLPATSWAAPLVTSRVINLAMTSCNHLFRKPGQEDEFTHCIKSSLTPDKCEDKLTAYGPGSVCKLQDPLKYKYEQIEVYRLGLR